MFESIGAWLGGLPTAGVVALGVLVVVQLAIQVYDLIDLARRKSVPYGKWLWVAIIVLGNMLGALAYLAFGRRPASIDEVVPAEPGRHGSTLDSLYGGSGGEPDA